LVPHHMFDSSQILFGQPAMRDDHDTDHVCSTLPITSAQMRASPVPDV
jgi:hypothetical protein